MIPVLFTTFNRLEYTKKTLPVLLKNTPDGRVIVVDNGSTDETVDYLRSQNGNIELILKPNNTGISGAMNTFFEMTGDADHVAKVDNDTLVPPGWLTDLFRILDLANLEIVQAAHYFFDRYYKDWDDLLERRPVKRFSRGNVVYPKNVGGSGIVFKRGIIQDPLPDEGLNAWTYFQHQNKQYRRGMYDGVWVDLLDMAGFNQYADDVDNEYFVRTGRLQYA